MSGVPESCSDSFHDRLMFPICNEKDFDEKTR